LFFKNRRNRTSAKPSPSLEGTAWLNMPPPPRAITAMLRSAAGAADVAYVEQRYGDAFNAINAACYWVCMGRHAKRSSEARAWIDESEGASALLSAQAMTLRVLPQMEVQALANTAHGAASAGACRRRASSSTHYSEEYGEEYVSLLERYGESYGENESSSSAQYSSSGSKPTHERSNGYRPLWEGLQVAASRRLADANTTDLMQLAWGFAVGQSAEPALFNRIAAAASERIEPRVGGSIGASSRPPAHAELVGLAWAFGSARHDAPALYESIAHICRDRISDLSASELSQLIWGFGRSGGRDALNTSEASALFEDVATHMLSSKGI